MRFPHLALALTATAAFSVLGASPALAAVSLSPVSQATAFTNGSPTTPVADVVSGVCGFIPGGVGPVPCGGNMVNDGWDKA